ncbi:MAG: hypothetical protein HY720_12515 [Planctomycetes bacterium]|nr:hypothetical protein [Planctomycetota bacterium]
MRKTNDLRELAGRHPFVPFEISLKNGQSFAISHPENIFIRDWVAAVAWVDDEGDERITIIYPAEIVSIDVLKKNGRRRRKTRK